MRAGVRATPKLRSATRCAGCGRLRASRRRRRAEAHLTGQSSKKRSPHRRRTGTAGMGPRDAIDARRHPDHSARSRARCPRESSRQAVRADPAPAGRGPSAARERRVREVDCPGFQLSSRHCCTTASGVSPKTPHAFLSVLASGLFIAPTHRRQAPPPVHSRSGAVTGQPSRAETCHNRTKLVAIDQSRPPVPCACRSLAISLPENTGIVGRAMLTGLHVGQKRQSRS